MKKRLIFLCCLAVVGLLASRTQAQVYYWERLTPSGTPPSPRKGHAAVSLPSQYKIVVFGGQDTGGLRNDLFTLGTGSPTWIRLTPRGTPPAPRAGHSAIFVPSRNRVLLFGGYTTGGHCLNDIWALDSLASGGVLSQLFPNGTPPSPRAEHSAIFDPVYDRMIIYGGRDSLANPLADLWALDSLSTSNGHWHQLTPSGTPPPARYAHSAAYDTSTPRRMVMFGGRNASGALGGLYALSLTTTNGAWSVVNAGGDVPSPRYGLTAIYKTVNFSLWMMILFGGQSDSTHFLSDTYSLYFNYWTREMLPAYPDPRAEMPGVPGEGNYRILEVIGGNLGDSLANDVWIFMQGGDAVEERRVRGMDGSTIKRFNAIPNPFTSFTSVPGHSSERFALYDVSGRKVGVYKGDRIGADVPPGVYFLRPIGQAGKPLRVVKVR